MDLLPKRSWKFRSNSEDNGLEKAYLYTNKNTWSIEELRAYDYAEMREQDGKIRMTKMVRDAKIEIAKNLKESGIDINIIIQITGLTEKEINDL